VNPQGVKIVLGLLAGLIFFHWYLWHQWRSGRLLEGWRTWQRFVHSARRPWSHWKEEDAQMQALRQQVEALQQDTTSSPQGANAHEQE